MKTIDIQTREHLLNQKMLLSERLGEILAAVDAILELEGNAALKIVRDSLFTIRPALTRLPDAQ